ncbi:hypothetical protein [Paenibacillus hamazuiensis]|uniref:YphA family membrane protein n=1 Tax=Paenibacillus hamazuiensis TaxID=2936508 RepID=UPI00201016D3|nr:hypothetical protein [Paenibacillus hamazuiensis]
MNPGYLSLLLIAMTLILLASGWKDVLVRGISHKAILLFFVLWLGTSKIVIPFGSWRIYGCACVAVVISAAVIAKTESFMLQCHLVSVGLLLGSIYFFLQEASHLIPAMMAHPDLNSSLLVGFSAFLMTRLPLVQAACVSVGLLLGDAYSVYVHSPEGFPAVIGGPRFQDRWWLALWMARGSSVVWQGVCAGGRSAARYWAGRRKEGADDRMGD